MRTKNKYIAELLLVTVHKKLPIISVSCFCYNTNEQINIFKHL